MDNENEDKTKISEKLILYTNEKNDIYNTDFS